MSKSSSGSGIIASMLIVLVTSIGLPVGGFGLGYGTGLLRYDVLGPPYQELAHPENTENNQSKQDVQKASCAGPNLKIENGTVTWISETWAQNGGRSIPGYENLVDSPTAPQTPTNQDTTDNLNQEPIATTTQGQTPPQAQNPAQSQGTSQNAGNTNKVGNSTASKPSSPQTQTGVKIDPSSQSNKLQNSGTDTQSKGSSQSNTNNSNSSGGSGFDTDRFEHDWSKGKFLGSTESDKYHYKNCSNGAERIRPEHERWFDSEEQAKAAGYKRCGICW